MKNIRNKRVRKLTVGDLKKALKGKDDDTEIVLSMYIKDNPNVSVYLAEVYGYMKYDHVTNGRLFEESIVELVGFDHDYCTYVEKNDGKTE